MTVTVQADRLKELLSQVGSSGTETVTLGEDFVSDDKQTVVVSVESGLAALGVEVNYQLLRSAVQRFAGQVNITASENQLIVKSGRAQSKLPIKVGVPVVLPPLEGGTDFPLADLKTMLKFASQASNPAALGYECGVQLTRQTAAGTDGERLHLIEMAGPDVSILVPAVAVKAVLGLKGSAVRIYDSPRGLAFRSGGVTIHSQKLAAVFPNVNSFVPAKFDFEAELDAKSAANSLHGVAHALDSLNTDVVLEFSNEILTVKTSGQGEAQEEIGYTQIAPEPDPFEPVNFSYKFKARHRTLQDFFDSVEGKVRLSAAHVLILAAQNKKLMTRVIKV